MINGNGPAKDATTGQGQAVNGHIKVDEVDRGG